MQEATNTLTHENFADMNLCSLLKFSEYLREILNVKIYSVNLNGHEENII